MEDSLFRREPNHTLYGKLPFELLLRCNSTSNDFQAKPDLPPSSIILVENILRSKKLPTELVFDILSLLLDGEPRGRLPVAHDPFHLQNREELDKYLKYCWELLVRCTMVTVELDMQISWREIITDALIALLSCDDYRRPWCRTRYDDALGQFDTTFI